MSEHTIFDVSAELRSICGHDSFSVEDCFTCAAADLIESRSARIESQAAQIAALKTVMIAAAEEIASHWDAHCDAEGYGPVNLQRRLEEGIASEYGYTAGAFEKLRAENATMKRANDELNAECLRLGHLEPDAERYQWLRTALLDFRRAGIELGWGGHIPSGFR